MLKGYATPNGYMGYVEGIGYLLFETDEAYYEYMEELNDEIHRKSIPMHKLCRTYGQS